MHKQTYVSRRMIGDVNIFDLHGLIANAGCEGIHDYISSYINECHIKNVIINAKEVSDVESSSAHRIISSMTHARKSVMYCQDEAVLERFRRSIDESEVIICKSEPDLLPVFGKELVEKDKIIEFTERRHASRIKTASLAQIDFIDTSDKVTRSSALVTNFSDGGLYAEYFDLEASLKVCNFNFFKDLKVMIQIKNPSFSDEELLQRKASILRIELCGEQTGVAFKFAE